MPEASHALLNYHNGERWIGIVKQGDRTNALLNGHHDLQPGQFKSLFYRSLPATCNFPLWLYAKTTCTGINPSLTLYLLLSSAKQVSEMFLEVRFSGQIILKSYANPLNLRQKTLYL